MKRYFVDGNEISEAQAILIENENSKLINSGDIASLIGCKFITIINNLWFIITVINVPMLIHVLLCNIWIILLSINKSINLLERF